MKKLLCSLLMGALLTGCAANSKTGLKVMEQFLKECYSLKFTSALENPAEPEEMESYWAKFYESVSKLCTESAFDKIIMFSLSIVQ